MFCNSIHVWLAPVVLLPLLLLLSVMLDYVIAQAAADAADAAESGQGRGHETLFGFKRNRNVLTKQLNKYFYFVLFYFFFFHKTQHSV